MAVATFGGLAGFGAESASTGIKNNNFSTRAGSGLGQRGFFTHGARPPPNFATLPRSQSSQKNALSVSSTAFAEPRTSARGQKLDAFPEYYQEQGHFSGESGSLPQELFRLLDPNADVALPNRIDPRSLDNRELDKLVGALGRSKATWRRALLLHEWLLSLGHAPDDRLCTTLIRVCSQHGQAMTALSLYDWMRSSKDGGGAGLVPTVYTYTAAMRAALAGNMLDRAFKVWLDAVADSCEPDCRMATTLIEVCTRKGDTLQAMRTYELMRDARPDSKMAPSVHAYTAAMRAAAEGGLWEKALAIWEDMVGAGCRPTGHAFAAVISACAAGGAWRRAVALFEEMVCFQIKPDVVSCTALITALGADGQWTHAQAVVDWMMRSGVKPNVRTYTALVTAMGNAQQWDRALEIVRRMKAQAQWGGCEPNAYTYSALLKTMGEQGQWQRAEEVFRELEDETAVALERENRSSGESSGQGSPAQPALQWVLPVGSARGSGEDGSGVSWAALGQSLVDEGGLLGGPQRSLTDFGALPESVGEQVLKSPQHSLADGLPEFIPGQSNLGPDPTSGPSPEDSSRDLVLLNGGSLPSSKQPWSGLALHRRAPGPPPASSQQMVDTSSKALVPPPSMLEDAARWGLEMRGDEYKLKTCHPVSRGRGPLNEVVCGAIMLAYERAGRWEQAVGVLGRAERLGILPNTIMCNTAISALGKAGRWREAETLFRRMPAPDAISHETLLAAYGMSGETARAEGVFRRMEQAGMPPRDYAFCGLIAAHSVHGDWAAALRVRQRMRLAGAPVTVHVYNALLAAAERANRCNEGLDLYRAMQREGVAPNAVTQRLLLLIGQKGVSEVQGVQAAAAALSTAVAAAGTLFMHTGAF